MKQKSAIPSIDELKSMYKKELEESSDYLMRLYERINRDSDARLAVHQFWQNDYYNFCSNPNYPQNENNLMVLHKKSNERAYAIPVVYCNADGTSHKKAGWNGMKIYTLYNVISENGEKSVMFVSNRYSGHILYPDFKSVGYEKNFGTHTQYIAVDSKKSNQKFFDIDCLISERKEESIKREEMRRSKEMTITVGMWEDLMEEIKSLKERL